MKYVYYYNLIKYKGIIFSDLVDQYHIVWPWRSVPYFPTIFWQLCLLYLKEQLFLLYVLSNDLLALLYIYTAF
jgi:hypothetical protein